MREKYVVHRPPLNKNFDLPKRNKLLKLRSGDLVKLRFQVESDDPERMWVILQDCSNDELWFGLIDNDSHQALTAKVLPAGKQVQFHPLDIIATE